MSSYENGHRTRLGRIWNNMKKRCYNEKNNSYCWYGAKGIKVCDEWVHDFDAFKAWALAHGYRDDLTIDRIDSNGNYSPDNCRWVTVRDQAYNRSTNNNLTFDGKTMAMTEWANLIGMNYRTLSKRIREGWPVEKALTTPVDQRYSHNPTVRRAAK